MAEIWEEENKFKKWLEIEILICEAYVELSLIPREDLKIIKENSYSIIIIRRDYYGRQEE
jgi:adenylosuccinate lyase